MIGKQAKAMLDQVRKTHGSNVKILRHMGTSEQKEIIERMMPNRSKEAPNRPYYSFDVQADVMVDDVLQIEGGRDLWRITETEDQVVAGAVLQVMAYYEKIGSPPRHVRSGSVNILNVQNMSNSQIQQGSHHSSQTQNNTNGLGDLKDILNIIVKAVESSDVSTERKELAVAHVAMLKQQIALPAEHRSAELAKSAWSGLSKFSDLVTVAPYLAAGARLVAAIFAG